MKMKNQKNKLPFATVVAMAMTLLTAFLVVAMTIFLPSILDFYLEYVSGGNSSYISTHKTAILVLLYAALVPVYVAVAGLFMLLSNVHCGRVFTRSSVRLIGILSACVYAESVICAVLSRYFILGAVLCFAALRLGTLLLVVRSVIAQATEIKAENDFTV